MPVLWVGMDRTIPTPPLVRLLDFVPWERKSTLSVSRPVSLSDHISWVNRSNWWGVAEGLEDPDNVILLGAGLLTGVASDVLREF
jgi:hypothetical protein